METACLRIKFIPLLQKNNKNSSKCCLEIVPEVSCVQNLDKLTWRQETNFIEYTIPMTYKVILKKHQASNASNDVVKTYHSCVDLLLASSKSALNIGSGDVSKIISDTFIFSKPLDTSSNEENVFSNAIESVPTSDIIRKYPVSHKTTNTSIRVVDFVNKETKTNEDGAASINMKNQQAVVDQIVQNLAFEVEAVPKEPLIHNSSLSKITPLNVKIKVRKKDEIQTDNEEPNEHKRTVQKIRLVSSDQTIMTFDVFMEAEFEKKPSKKSKKHILDILRPGSCLNKLDNDGYAYMPNASYSANITEPGEATRSDGVLRQNFTLLKNNYNNYSVATQSGVQKWPFGKCKPGGCLDPPFSEDRYSYKPSLRSGNEQLLLMGRNIPEEENEAEDVKIENKSNGRQSSIFDGGLLFKKRRKSSDKSTNTKGSQINYETYSNESLFDTESTVNSFSTHSNSIITYPPKISSDLRISDDKTARSRGPSEDKSRKSFNEHSEPYFVPPKGVSRIKEKDFMNQADSARSSKEIDLEERKNSTKIPVPIPIPIPIPFISGRFKSDEPSENVDLTNTQVGEDDEQQMKPIPDEDENDNLITATNSTHSKIESALQDIDDSHVQNLMLSQSKVSSFGSLKQKSDDNDIVKINDANKKSQTSLPNNVYDESRTNSMEKSKTDTYNIPIPTPLNVNMDKRPNSLANDIITEQSEQSLSTASASKDNTESPIFNSHFDRISDDQNSNKGDKLIQTPKENDTRDSVNKENESLDDTDDPTVQGDVARESNEEKNKYNLENNEPDIIKPMGDQEYHSLLQVISVDNDEGKLILNDDTDDKMSSETDNVESGDVERKLEENGDKQRQSALSNSIYEMKNMLRTGLENDTDSLSNSILPSYNDDDSFISPTNGDKKTNSFKDSLTTINGISNNIIAAPVFIDDSKGSPPFRNLEQIYSSTNLTIDPPIHSIYNDDAVETKLTSQFGAEDTHSSHSHELVGMASVIYDLDGLISLNTPVKQAEKIFSPDQVEVQAGTSKDTSKNKFPPSKSSDTKLTDNDIKENLDNKKYIRSTSVLSSTSTLKSALKKDTISVELAFHSYINDANERTVRTFDASYDPLRVPNDTITLIKSQIRLSSNEIRIPVDSDHDLSIQIKKPYANQRVSISESGFVKSLDKGKLKIKASAQTSDGELLPSELNGFHKIGDDIRDTSVIDLYEQELVPLQLIIKSLRDEIDVLAAQQMMFRDKIFSPKKTKMPRLVHSNKKCVGCLKK